MAATTSQWWRRLVNAYEVKAGMVHLQGKSCMIHIWGEVLTIGRYTNLVLVIRYLYLFTFTFRETKGNFFSINLRIEM